MQFAVICPGGDGGATAGPVIVSRRDGHLLLVRQVDHQDQCALMARAWGNPVFRRAEPWAPVVTAAGLHDEGWRPFDDAPEVDAAGRPVDFPDLDRGRHVALYQHGIDTAVARDAAAGLLVAMHGQGLHEARLGLDGEPRDRSALQPEVRRFIERQETLRARLATELAPGITGDWAWAAYRVLQAIDLLSLHLLWLGVPRGTGGVLPGVPRGGDDDEGVDLRVTPDGDAACVVSPWPFAASTVDLPVACRRIPDRVFRDHDDLRGAIARAAPEVLRCVARERPAA